MKYAEMSTADPNGYMLARANGQFEVRTDNKGRLDVGYMTDRELMEESVLLLRTVADLGVQLADQIGPAMQAMQSNPIISKMFGLNGH